MDLLKVCYLRSFTCKYTTDERSSDSSHTGLTPTPPPPPQSGDKSGQTAQDTSKADNDQSDNFMSASHKQAITAKGADCRSWPPETNKQTRTPSSPFIPAIRTTEQSHTQPTVRIHPSFSRQTHESAHTRSSPLLCLSLPDETNRTLIHKMEGKNALVCNHWLLHRLGGWIKGQSNIISWYRPWQITASRRNMTTLTLLSTSAYSLAYDEW